MEVLEENNLKEEGIETLNEFRDLRNNNFIVGERLQHFIYQEFKILDLKFEESSLLIGMLFTNIQGN